MRLQNFTFQAHVRKVLVPLPPRCVTLLPCLPGGLFTPRSITPRRTTPQSSPPTPMGKPSGYKSCKQLHQPRCEGTVDENIKKNICSSQNVSAVTYSYSLLCVTTHDNKYWQKITKKIVMICQVLRYWVTLTLWTHSVCPMNYYTDKKENKTFIIYKEI